MLLVGRVAERICLGHGGADCLRLLFTMYKLVDIRSTNTIPPFLSTHPPNVFVLTRMALQVIVFGGWCYCTHLFGVETNAGTQHV